MASLLDIVITFGVLAAIILFGWSKFQHQTVKETIVEIKDIIKGE